MFRALRHRNYRLFFAGQIISLVGTWMQTVAQAWLVYRLTGSGTLLGLVAFTSHFPVFVFASLGGLAADRFNRHHILIGTQLVSMVLALTLALITFTEVVEVWHLMVLAALLGATNGFDIPARQSFVIEMVGRDDLMNAIALNSSVFNGARVAGPAIAGIVVALVGEAWCFLINGVSYVGVLAGLLAMRLSAIERPPPGPAFRHLIDGFRYAATTRPIRALLLLLAILAFTGMPYTVMMPLFADRVLSVGADGLGYLMGAAGFGAFLASITLARKPTVRGLGRWVAFAAGGFGASLIVFAFSRSFWLSVILLVPVGFSMVLEMASSNTLIQSMVPDELRGRVMAIYSMTFMGMAPLGSLVAGWSAERFGAPAAVVIGGSICLAASIVFLRQIPLLRGEARRLILTQQLTAGGPNEGTTGTGARATREE
jgi:MFS family permease